MDEAGPSWSHDLTTAAFLQFLNEDDLVVPPHDSHHLLDTQTLVAVQDEHHQPGVIPGVVVQHAQHQQHTRQVQHPHHTPLPHHTPHPHHTQLSPPPPPQPSPQQQSVVQQQAAQQLVGGEVEERGGKKRGRLLRAGTSTSGLPELSLDDEDAGMMSSGDEGELNKPLGKGKVNQAAKNKACREKARREKINDRFTELAKLVDPGKEPKTDKLSILGDALRFVQQVQVENSQLKQLNKFLEERLGQYEKERSHIMYQQMMAQGFTPAGMMPSMPSMPSMPPMPPPPLHPMMAHSTLVTGFPANRGLSNNGNGNGGNGANGGNDVKPDSGEEGHTPQQQQHVPQALPQHATKAAMAPMPALSAGYWLHPSMIDPSQDSLLRPPAA